MTGLLEKVRASRPALEAAAGPCDVLIKGVDYDRCAAVAVQQGSARAAWLITPTCQTEIYKRARRLRIGWAVPKRWRTRTRSEAEIDAEIASLPTKAMEWLKTQQGAP